MKPSPQQLAAEFFDKYATHRLNYPQHGAALERLLIKAQRDEECEGWKNPVTLACRQWLEDTASGGLETWAHNARECFEDACQDAATYQSPDMKRKVALLDLADEIKMEFNTFLLSARVQNTYAARMLRFALGEVDFRALAKSIINQQITEGGITGVAPFPEEE